MSELRIPTPPRRHLLAVRDLGGDDVERILETAKGMASALDREVKKLPTLRGRTVVHLFYESSTRTLASFELAAKRDRGSRVHPQVAQACASNTGRTS